MSFIFLLGTIDSSVHEFCHLSLMGLISDFFLQICFFVPILSMDMNQLELSDSVKKPVRNRKMFQKPISGMYLYICHSNCIYFWIENSQTFFLHFFMSQNSTLSKSKMTTSASMHCSQTMLDAEIIRRLPCRDMHRAICEPPSSAIYSTYETALQ